MAVKIRLKRIGKIRAPYYRVVVADSRTRRDGRAIEEIGRYHPTDDPSLIEIDSERVQHWLGVGAQPTEQVLALLKVTGDWQTFKGLPGAEGSLKAPTPKLDRAAQYEAAMRKAGIKTTTDAPAPSGRGSRSSDRSSRSTAPAGSDTSADAAEAPPDAAADAAGTSSGRTGGGRS